jgi:hypothetical protein
MLTALLHIADRLKPKKPVVVKESPRETALREARGSFAGPPKQKDPNAKRNNKFGPRKD